MRQSGCRRVYLGLETGDPDTLRLMKKQASVEDGRTAVELFHEAGIEVAAFFIVGYPGETPSSVEATLQWAIELPLDYISFNVPFPLPGSPLFERLHSVNPNKDWNEENEVSFVYDSEFDADWLRQRIGATMQAFADKKGHK
jgi:anaerobic magnesium-protoporphyrin IX monomethyl ester cyclase